MKAGTSVWAALALSGILSVSQTAVAQGYPSSRPQDRDDNRSRSQDRDDDRSWNAPRGYNDYYRENGNSNMVARQGYAAGFTQGESDFRGRHSFRPTKVDSYKHVPESPKDFNRDDFKRLYREAFERGYAKGYGR